MLGIMRKYKQSAIIKVVFGIIVFSFIGTIFLVWGRGSDGLAGGFVAKVNGTNISGDDFQKSYYRLRGIYEQIYGKSLTPELEKQMGLKKTALDSLIDAVLISREAKKMGIKVSKDEVSAAIAKVPAFQRNGSFNFEQYLATLKANRITPQNFEDNQKEEILNQKVRAQVMAKTTVNEQDLLQAFKKQNEQIDLSFVSYSPTDVKSEVNLTDQDLNTYLQEHQDEFKVPEQVSIAYTVIEPARFATNMKVTDEEAQTYYQKNIDRYQAKGEILPFADVKERAKADALKLKAAKEAYEKAADAANKNQKTGDLNAAAAAIGGKISQTALFTSKSPATAIAGESELLKKAFMVKQGELGGPVETARGIYILKVTEKLPAAVPPLAQIKAQVSQKATEAKARDLSKKRAEEALAQLTKGDSALKLQETGNFGYAATGVIPRIGASPELMEAAFNLTMANPVPKTVFKSADRWYAVKLKQRSEANSADFQAKKESLRQALLPKKQQETLDAWLKDLKAKAKIEISPSVLAD